MNKDLQSLCIADMELSNFLLFFNETPHFINFNWCELQLSNKIFIKFLAVFCYLIRNISNSIEMMPSDSCYGTKTIFLSEMFANSCNLAFLQMFMKKWRVDCAYKVPSTISTTIFLCAIWLFPISNYIF